MAIVFVSFVGDGIDVAFVVVDVGVVDLSAASGFVAFAMILATCERDCILFCCSVGFSVPTDEGTAEAAVLEEDKDEEDAAEVFPLSLTDALIFVTFVDVSTTGGSGGFGM